jgi:hypothetical protein
MPKTGGFPEPLVFMVVMGLVGGVLQTLFSFLHLHAAGMVAGAVAVIVVPIVVAIFGFIVAGILFVIWKMMGSEEEYETAYRCIAYMSALSPITTVLGLIPYIGGPLGLLISTYYLVIASAEVHKIAPRKAWMVFGTIAGILALITISGEIAARRMAGNIEEAAESWKKAAQQAEEMQKRMQKEMTEKLAAPKSP